MFAPCTLRDLFKAIFVGSTIRPRLTTLFTGDYCTRRRCRRHAYARCISAFRDLSSDKSPRRRPGAFEFLQGQAVYWATAQLFKGELDIIAEPRDWIDKEGLILSGKAFAFELQLCAFKTRISHEPTQ